MIYTSYFLTTTWVGCSGFIMGNTQRSNRATQTFATDISVCFKKRFEFSLCLFITGTSVIICLALIIEHGVVSIRNMSIVLRFENMFVIYLSNISKLHLSSIVKSILYIIINVIQILISSLDCIYKLRREKHNKINLQ